MLTSLRERYRASRTFRWLTEGIVVMLIIAAVSALQTRNHFRGTPPPFTLHTLDGAPVELSSLQGKPTLLTVWAPWCGVCKAESGNVSRAAHWLEGRANVVSVATAFRDVSQVKSEIVAQNIDYPVLVAGEDFTEAMGVAAFPTLYVLDSQGRVVGSTQGYVTTLGFIVRALLA
jgi:thiol-disulfide isomerase/thioredoxin